MMKKIIFALLMFISCSAWSEWVLVGTSADDDKKFYIDPETIRREGVLVKYWKLSNLKVRNKSGDMSWRSREELDCKKERYRLTSITTFSEPMLGGSMTGHFNYPNDEWRDIPPGTLDAAKMKYVCAK
jgi:hypothetical protein